MPSLNGWKTAIGMAAVIAGQICHLLAPKWPFLMGLGTVLMDVGAALGVVGLSHKAIKAIRVSE